MHIWFVSWFAILFLVVTHGSDAQDRVSAPDDACLSVYYPADNYGALRLFDNLVAALSPTDICIWSPEISRTRAIHRLRSGELDGEIGRIADYAELTDGFAFAVSEPLSFFNGYLITKDQDARTLDDFKGQSIGIIGNALWQEKAVRGRARVMRAHDVAGLHKLLERDRVAAILVAYPEGYPMPQDDGLIRHVIYHQPLFLYLLNRHRPLEPRISDAIKAYKARRGDMGMSNPSDPP